MRPAMHTAPKLFRYPSPILVESEERQRYRGESRHDVELYRSRPADDERHDVCDEHDEPADDRDDEQREQC